MRFIGCKDKLRDRMRCKDQKDVGSADQSGLIWRKHKMWEMTDHAHRPRLACHSTAAPVGGGERGEGIVVEHRVVRRCLGTLLKHLRWKDVTTNNAPETFEIAKKCDKKKGYLQAGGRHRGQVTHAHSTVVRPWLRNRLGKLKNETLLILNIIFSPCHFYIFSPISVSHWGSDWLRYGRVPAETR